MAEPGLEPIDEPQIECPPAILKKVAQFREHFGEYHNPSYNEAQVRIDFINPMLEALGWDVENKAGYAEAYRDVVYEDAVKISGTSKAPDYGFYIGGRVAGGGRKFFLEAKKPAIPIRTDAGPAYQLRRYAWTAKLPLSILTNFEDFVVYDTRVEPIKGDRALSTSVLKVNYTEYGKRWHEIASVYSLDAIRRGSFDRFTQTMVKRRDARPVDVAFLTEIEGWRESLAKNMALRNPTLSQRDLNFAVQRTIDRIVFLRMCEDRGIEPSRNLAAIVDFDDVYSRLSKLFRNADDRYNSGLFHFATPGKKVDPTRTERPDELTLELQIDDKVLEKILKRLYDSSYEFSVMPPEILGQVYERFLGKVITLDSQHRAIIEEKPEVRKAGGVFYTPAHVVDYIVKNTVGNLLEGHTPKEAARLNILDPACGSGSFLIGAYQYLLDWHLRWYLDNDPISHCKGADPPLMKVSTTSLGDDFRLTTKKRKQILLDTVFGVDVDPQAVEVTKLSLLLKVLEGESIDSLAAQLKLFHQRALPDLGKNIKCGNSLIAPDFYTLRRESITSDERVRINAFNWKAEFPEIFRNGAGFDAVIGNPPYKIVFGTEEKSYLELHYPTFCRNNDLYVAFLQKAKELIKPKSGVVGYIIPNTMLLGPYFDEIKKSLLESGVVYRVVDFGICRVFEQPNVFTCLVFFRSGAATSAEDFTEYVRLSEDPGYLDGLSFESLPFNIMESLRWAPLTGIQSKLEKISHGIGDVAHVKDVGLNYWTVGRGKKRGGSIADRILYAGPQENPRDLHYVKGRDIDRYLIREGMQWLRHDYENHLHPEVDVFRFSEEFLCRPKIIYRQTADHIIAAFDAAGKLTDKTSHLIALKDEWASEIDPLYLVALLNSKLMVYVYRALTLEEGRTFAQVKTFRVKELPLVLPKEANAVESGAYQRLVSLSGIMASRKSELQNVKNPLDQERLMRELSSADAEIDSIVCKIYQLNEDETRLVLEPPLT